MKKPAKRLLNLPANFFSDLPARIAAFEAQGHDVIRLDIGSPDLPPPEPVVEALVRSARQPHNHGYTPHQATPELRQAWARYYVRNYGVELDAETQVLPLLGSKEGIFHLVQAWIDPGDVVLVPDPGYMTYTRAALFAGGSVFPLPLLPENGYLPDLESIPANVLQRAKMLWLNYPHNPTAAVADQDFFARAVAFARQHDLLLCHDAAYARVTFDGYRAPSLLEIPGAFQVAVEVNSLSKSHNLAGWRLGVIAGNPQAVTSLLRLKTNQDSGHFLPVLQAACAALDTGPDWIARRNERYQRRRDLLVAGLQALGLPVVSPRASIYVWCPLPSGWSSIEFATFLLEKAQVSVTPGAVFGEHGDGYVRFSLTVPAARISEAVQRIRGLQD